MNKVEPHVIGADLIRVLNDFYRRHDQFLDESDFPKARFRYAKVLFNLDREHGTRLVDLARMGRMRVQSMAQLVNEMEADGMVERRPDPSDGRAKRICYTDKGLSFLKGGRQASLAVWEQYAEIIGRAEMQALHAQLQKIAAAHKEQDQQSSDRGLALAEA